MMKKWYEGEISAITDISASKRQVFLQLKDEDTFNFVPGQFITADLPIGTRRLERWRSYSLANNPNEENILELCIGKLENGSASSYFFNDIRVGSTLKFKGPEGTFVLPQNIHRNIVMICTGTGVVPFRSMLMSLAGRNTSFPTVHLIFGAKYADEILYKKEFKHLADVYDQFEYSVILSREQDWDGPKGYVHQIYLDRYQACQEDTLFMICGWTNMIDEAVSNLSKLVSDPSKQIMYELYG